MWLNPQFPADLVIFTEEIPMENFIFCPVFPLAGMKDFAGKYFPVRRIKTIPGRSLWKMEKINGFH